MSEKFKNNLQSQLLKTSLCDQMLSSYIKTLENKPHTGHGPLS